MEPGFNNPLLESRSFKETWGTRWNLPVNALLKRTIYIPLRKSGIFNQQFAAALTFFVSGLLHEYNFSMHNHRSSGYQLGEVTVFFLVMQLLIVGESWIWKQSPEWVQIAISRLPSVVISTFLTLMVSGLAERYFLRSWFESGMVEAIAQLVPHLSYK